MFRQSACIECLYTELPFPERFAAAKMDGFDSVEFWSWRDKDLGMVEQLAQNIGISGFNGDGDYSLIDPAQKSAYLAGLERSIEAALLLGAESLAIHSNALDKDGLVANAYPNLSDTVKLCAMYDTLGECAKLAEDSGVLLYLEALNIKEDHVGNYLISSTAAAEITRLIGSPNLKILYDVYHMQLNEGNLCRSIEKCIDQIGHIHIADVPGRHEPGTGEINYHKILQQLQKLGYQGRLGYELFPQTTTAEAVQAIWDLWINTNI